MSPVGPVSFLISCMTQIYDQKAADEHLQKRSQISVLNVQCHESIFVYILIFYTMLAQLFSYAINNFVIERLV